MTMHLVLNEYTFCGKHIDALRAQETIILIQSTLAENWELVARFKSDLGACKICLNELIQEEQLVFQKNNFNDEENNEPVI